MLRINDVELNFDITAPEDVTRYKEAAERMDQKANSVEVPDMPEDDSAYIDAYIAMLNRELRIFGDFIDDVFGDGVAEKLLGNNPSLNKVNDIMDALDKAFETQGKEYGVSLQAYKPNRATRRAR